MKHFWLWVWVMGRKIKNGWEFDTREEAELYFNRHFKRESVKHEITKE